MILALSRFTLLIINALQPARSMERNRLTRICQKTIAGPWEASQCPGGACLKAQVELRALLLEHEPWWSCLKGGREMSSMSNISVGARAHLRPGERLAYHSFIPSVINQKYVLSTNFVPGIGYSNKQDRQALCAVSVTLVWKHTINMLRNKSAR